MPMRPQGTRTSWALFTRQNPSKYSTITSSKEERVNNSNSSSSINLKPSLNTMA